MNEENVIKDVQIENEPKIIEGELSRPRFLEFKAIISNEIDSNGNFVINYFYSRKNFPIENVGGAIKSFEKHVIEDMKNI